jgi:hypothetical protein
MKERMRVRVKVEYGERSHLEDLIRTPTQGGFFPPIAILRSTY